MEVGALPGVAYPPYVSRIEEIRATHYAPQLGQLGLTDEQIDEQSFDQLQASLQTVDQALQTPQSFGTIRLLYLGGATVAKVTHGSEFHEELDIVPLLLRAKRRILERIESLGGARRIETLRDVVREVADDGIRARLEHEIEQLEAQSRELQALSTATVQKEAELRAQEVQARMGLEVFERRSKVWLSFLERESVASLLGGVVLLVLVGVQAVAMFRRVAAPDILNNAFLLILGYFFGQAALSRKSTQGGG